MVYLVLQLLQDVKENLNADKCEFLQQSITFVGNKVSNEGIAPDNEKVTPKTEMPTPSCVTEF